MESTFKNKSVIVTGAGRGIGRAMVKKFHELGANIYAISRSPENLAALKLECPNITTISVDLGDWKATRAAVEKLDVVDYLVNNAAIYYPGNFMDATEELIDTTCNVNLKGVVNVSQVVAKKMIEAGRAGSIVNISSICSVKPLPMFCAYSMLKAGLDQLTKIMALELGPSKIRVNSVNPGGVLTEQWEVLADAMKNAPDNIKEWVQKTNDRIPLEKKMVEMDECVNSTLFLLSDAAPMMTGNILLLDGGLSIS